MTRVLNLVLDEEDRITATLRIESGSHVKIADELPSEKLTAKYQEKLRHEAPEILPPAVRYISPERNLLIWERPPSYITVNYSPKKQSYLSASGDSAYVYRLPVPWQVYVIGYNSQYVMHTIYMYFRTAPLSNESKDVCLPPLSNFYATGKLCQAVYDDIPDATNLFQMLNNAYEMIWNSGFNDDLYDSMNNCIQRAGRNHPFLMSGADIPGTYNRWGKLGLDKIMELQWNMYSDNIFNVIQEERRAKTKNIEATQFVMDLQSIT